MSQVEAIPQESKRNLSRDEMNLAEFPLAVLSTRTDPNVKTLEFADRVKGRNGEVVDRKWIITGADKFGLPTASDDEVLLGLLKLTSDSQFVDRKIEFTRYELLKILRWTTEGRSYSRLQKALDRLSGVRIKTTNGFYDNESKLHSTRNFGIIDAYEINDGRSIGAVPVTKPSFFVWSEAIFKSFQSGFIKKLDLNFLLDLNSAVSKRLYRYLDKHFWYKAKLQNNLFTLCHEKLGISRNYSYASQLKQQIDPAVEELIARGFLLGCEYSGKGSGTEVTFYAANGARKERVDQDKVNNALSMARAAKPTPVDLQEKGGLRYCEGDEGSDLLGSCVDMLVQRGIREQQAQKLMTGFNEKLLKRVTKIVAYFDQLISSGSPRISKSPVGFLYRAVENPGSFILPGERIESPAQTKMMLKEPRTKTTEVRKVRTEKDSLEALYLSERKRELEKLRGEIEHDMHVKIRSEVESALVKVRGLISSEKFEDAVNHGIEERLCKLFALPDFAEWCSRRERATARRVAH